MLLVLDGLSFPFCLAHYLFNLYGAVRIDHVSSTILVRDLSRIRVTFLTWTFAVAPDKGYKDWERMAFKKAEDYLGLV